MIKDAKKPSRINRENYREEVDLLLEGMRRSSHVGWEATSALNAEGIGNLLREFGEPGAEEWFRKAVAWYQKASSEPSIKVALTLWKTGDQAAFERQCREVLNFHRARVEAHERGTPLPEAQLIRAYQETACAHFLLGDYGEAVRAATRGLDAGYENGRPYVQTAIRDMARGMTGEGRRYFDDGLSVVEAKIREWPTASSSVHDDLYRYCISLQRPT